MPVETFLEVIERLPDALLLVTGEGVVLGANRRCARLGIEPSRLLGKPLSDITTQPPEVLAAYLRRCSKTSDPLPGSLTLRRSDGGEVPCRSHGSVLIPSSAASEAVVLLRLESKDASVNQFLTLNQKIDQLGKEILHRTRVQEELREQKEWLGVTLTSIGDAVIATDDEGHVTFINPVAQTLSGWTSEQAIGRPLPEVFRIVNETTRAVVENPVEKVLACGQVVGLANHTVLIARDGTELPIEDSAAPIKGEDGRIAGVVLVFHDVSEKRDAEAKVHALREQDRARMQNVLESITDGYMTMDPGWRHTYVNEVALRLTGMKREELIGRTHWEAFPGAVGTQLEAIFRRVAAERVTVEFENYYEPFGRWYANKVSPATDGGVLLSFEDITDRKRDAEELRQSEDRFHTLAETIPQLAWMARPDGDIFWYNRRWYDYTGTTPEEMQGWGWQRVHDPEVLPTVLDRWKGSIGTGEPFDMVFPIKGADGRFRPFLTRVMPLKDDEGRVRLWFGTNTDVTEQGRNAALLEQQKQVLELIAGGSSLASALDALCRMVENHSGNTLFASILIVDREEGGRLRHGGAPSLPEAYIRAIDGVAFGPGVGSCGTAAHRGEPVFVAEIATDPLWAGFAELALAHGLRACWSLPILSGTGDVLGTFVMYDSSPRHPTPDDLRIVDIVTRTASIAIERDRSESEQRRAAAATARRSEQLQKLAEISGRINSARDVNSVIGIVTEEARNLFGAKQAATSIVLDPSQPQPLNVVAVARNSPQEGKSAAASVAKLDEVLHAEQRPIRLAQDALGTDPRWKKLEEIVLVRPCEGGFLAAPVVGRDGKSMGLLQLADKEGGEFSEDDEVILLQLSRLAAIAVENARLYEELRTNDRRKDEFLAMLAHELRNPLAAISNAVTVTTRTGLREHIDWSMEVIGRQMKHLTRLIDDLMDVSRINRGKIELRRDVLDVTPILDSAATTVRSLAEERKHSLEVVIDRGNLWADVDPTRLEQVVVNLLNNAAKYSENAGHIRLSAEHRGDELIIAVRDKGVGISPEKLPQMFELFAQGDRTLARSEGGLGIGLTVVKKLVEMHDGSITAKSEGLGKGSEFTIRLPAAGRPDVARAKATGPAVQSSRRARILVVDDNVDTARGMARLLKLLGHEVAVAHDGHEAIEVAKEFSPEFVLLDIGLPGMDGYEVASRMRHEEYCKDAVIVAVSGYGQDEDRRRSKEAGFDHHLIKPLDHDALISLLSAGSNGRG